MDFTWRLEWDTDQQKPKAEFSKDAETISFAQFPDHEQSP